MSNYTTNLYEIIKNEFNIFDFEYTRTNESQAIISNLELETGFINHYLFREIGFETLDRFKHYLKTQWLESIENFDKLLIAYNDSINIKSNMGNNSQNVSVFNDTPKNALDFDDESTHATSITNNKQTNTGYAGVSEIELLDTYHNKLRDIITEFYDSFDNLFMQIF